MPADEGHSGGHGAPDRCSNTFGEIRVRRARRRWFGGAGIGRCAGRRGDLLRAAMRFAAELRRARNREGRSGSALGREFGRMDRGVSGMHVCGRGGGADGRDRGRGICGARGDASGRAAGGDGPGAQCLPKAASLWCGLEDFFEARGRGGDRSCAAAEFSPVAAGRGDAVEIVFTSGTTAEPRGVVLTHGNLLANLRADRERDREIPALRAIFPSAEISRSAAAEPRVRATAGDLHSAGSRRDDGVSGHAESGGSDRAIRAERVSLLVTVPRLIESLRDHVERDLEARGRARNLRARRSGDAQGEHFLKRWWRFRAIRRKFGWRFWAIVSGGAALPAAAEQFWDRLGYAVIQGYGLTETTSLVSLNHPFRLGKGSIGKTLPGLEVKLSGEGEILVRGENVASGYWKDAGVASVLDADGWFHTGDLGERDANGNLYFKGRQKNVIVTPEGLNVYPAGSGGGAAQGAGRARLRGGGAGARRKRGTVRGAAVARGAIGGGRSGDCASARTSAWRRFSRCADGWCGATRIFRARRRRNRCWAEFAKLRRRSSGRRAAAVTATAGGAVRPAGGIIRARFARTCAAG